jgi:hypothetical protein
VNFFFNHDTKSQKGLINNFFRVYADAGVYFIYTNDAGRIIRSQYFFYFYRAHNTKFQYLVESPCRVDKIFKMNPKIGIF